MTVWIPATCPTCRSTQTTRLGAAGKTATWQCVQGHTFQIPVVVLIAR